MRKFVVRLERAFIKVAVSPKLRPIEHDLALQLANSVLIRVGASSAVVALVVELIDRVLT